MRYEIDILKNSKNSNISKNNHMSILFINSGSTNSITEKGPRTSQKLSMTHTTLQRVDEKKKELTKNTKNILAPSNTLQNTSINSVSKNIYSKTSSTKYTD